MKDFLFLVLLFTATTTFPQQFINKSDNEITLDNGVIKEKISISEDSICPVELLHHTSEQNFIEKSRGFSFSLNDRKFSGYTGWKIMKNETIRDKTGGRGLKMLIRPADQTIKIQVTLHYMLYPGLPVIRKWITIKNTDESELKLEKVNIEDLVTTLSHVSSQVYHNYGRMKHLDKYIGNWDDPVVVVHNVTECRGIALGNETVGVLKRTTYHNNINSVEIGLTYPDQDFAFRKWLKPGESWESPKVFIAVYTNADDGFQIINNDVNEFVVKHMNPRIVTLDKKPTFVYNTWYPFRTFINDSLVREVARAAAECGIQEFILDDGWQINIGGETSEKGWGNNYGDWQVDTAKFPGGLKPTFDYIRTLGMKPGLWISIGAATKDAKVFKEHPEWFVKNENGKLTDLHLPNEQSDFYTSCYGTGWFNYIKQTILRLVNEHGLAYAKLDFAVVTSAYINDNSRSGCYATDHPHHKDKAESHWVLYQRLLKLFDELHEEAPELFIDCTFETAGKLQLMDYAIARHAEGNWLSNFEESSPVGPLRVRQMAWWRSPAVPAGSLVIGNQSMDNPCFEFSLKSLIGTLPIVLGDPREMSKEKREMIKGWSDWMQEMQEKYDYMSYRKDLAGFGEPREGYWDGWQRINFQTGEGGIFGVFRQGAVEETRRIVLDDLIPGKTYIVRQAPDGKEIHKATGEVLKKRGFEVTIKKLYDGKIFEVGE